MYQRIACCLAVLIGLTANAQTINLGGVVSNTGGKPIANAIVTLARQTMKDTTGSDGKYSFAKSVAVKLPASIPHAEGISMTNGVLQFTLSNPSPVKIEIFDVKGNLLKKETLKNAAAGAYRFDIAKNCQATNLLIIKAVIGKREVSYPYMTLNSGNYALNQSGASASSTQGGLTATAAVIDTLKVTATGYLTKTTTITTYDNQQQNITLDTAVGGAVTVQLDQLKQAIDGFGINNTWMGGWTDAEADEMFDSTSGIGLTILRIGMGPDGNPYNGTACWNDVKKAKSRGAKYIIGTCWTPPANMKSNNSLDKGGKLLPASYEAWATTVAAFAAKVKSGSGYDLYSMSPQNETDFASCGTAEPCNGDYNTCIYTGQEYTNFLKVVGPKIKAAGCKVMAPEASEWLHLWSSESGCCSVPGGFKSSDPLGCGFPSTCALGAGYNYGRCMYNDPTAWAQIDIIGTHQYDTQVAEPWPSDIPRGNLRVWQTEMSGVRYWPEQGPSIDISNGVAVAGWIHNALTVGEANAWCWWWYKPMGDITNEGLYTKTGSNYTKAKRLYTFGNYSKYVRPGMTRVDITGTIPANVLLTAYKGAGSTIVVVAINKGTASVTVPITISGGTAPSTFTPIVTSATENWVSKAALSVTGGILTVTLPGTTVTTFVGK